MTQSTSDRLADVFARASKRNDDVQAMTRDQREQAIEDRRFYSIAGAQYEGDESFDNLPRPEFNKIHLAVIRIINEYRNNRVTVKFRPDGREARDLADALEGLYRADEEYSNAQEAYDTAFEESAGGGMGAWRYRAVFEDEADEDDDKQRICIEAIPDADNCVFFDPGTKRADKKGAKWAIVITGMPLETFKADYPDAGEPANWPKLESYIGCRFDWFISDTVYVGEYYEIEEKADTVHYYTFIVDGVDRKKLWESDPQYDEKRDKLLATGWKEDGKKRVKRPRVHKYQMSGSGILKDEGIIAGREIPIVVTYGKRWYIDGIERFMGHVRLAKDAQRLKNMIMGMLSQIAVQSPAGIPIFEPEQVSEFGQEWSRQLVDRPPFLRARALRNPDGTLASTGPLAYTQPLQIPPAVAALAQILDVDLNDLLGNQQQGEKMLSNIGENTVELIQGRLDMQTYIYYDNFKNAMQRGGEIWYSMARDLYTEEEGETREMETLSEDGKPGSVTIMEPMTDASTAEQFFNNDFANARMKVTIDSGPNFKSRRNTTVKNLLAMMGVAQDPDDLVVLSSAAMMNMDGEGMSEIQDYFRTKLVRKGVIKPTEEEAEQMQQEVANQPPDPNAELLKAAAMEQQTKAQKNQADTFATQASANLDKAKTILTLQQVDSLRHDGAIAAVETVHKVSQPARPVK